MLSFMLFLVVGVLYTTRLTDSMQDSGNSSARKFLIASVGKKSSDVGSDLILPV